jgi:hypothetical protein
VEANPVQRRAAADELKPVLAEIEHDDVADDVAIVAHRRELLRLADFKTLEAVVGEIGEELDRVRSFDPQVVHVIRLIEEHRTFLPGDLLVAPVRVFRRHARINIRARRLIIKKSGRALHALKDRFEALGHFSLHFSVSAATVGSAS